MKITHVKLLDDNKTHIIMEISGYISSFFRKPKQYKIKVFAEKPHHFFYKGFNNENISYDNSKQLNAFYSTGQKEMSFVSE